MNNKNYCNKNKNSSSTPLSSRYSEDINNKEHEKSPYGEPEPSTKTTYK